MYDKQRLSKYFADKKEKKYEVIKRRFQEKSHKLQIYIGPRRSGKTYQLLAKKSQVEENQFIYLDFEDPTLSKTTPDEWSDLIEEYLSLFPTKKELCICIDEPQVIDNWESGVRKLNELFDAKIFITGSSAKLLSKEIATSLRGRAVSSTILPLSFTEFILFNNVSYDLALSTTKSAQLKSLFSAFLTYGGFPQVVLSQSDAEKEDLLKEYYQLVVYKDIVDRFNVKNSQLIKYLIDYVVSANTKQISLHKLFKTLQSQGMKISKNTLYEYYSMLVDAFFVISLPKYATSARKTELSSEKAFLIDVGYMSLFSVENYGKRLENVVLLEFFRKKTIRQEVYYIQTDSSECDFVIKEGTKITQAIQVCYNLNDENEKREIKGLVEACKTHKLTEGLLLTYDQEDSFEQDGVNITVKPVWKWLLE